MKMHTKEFFRTNLGSKDKINLFSGGIAGIWAMTATHPLERVKLMRIFGIKEFANQNFINSVFILARTKGVLSIFRGNAASWIREFPGAGLMFYFYETFKQISLQYKRPNDPELPYHAISGAWAGMLSSTLTYGLDPVKALMASDYEGKYGGIRDIWKTIYRKNGLKGFYHGYTATIWSVTPFIGKYSNLLTNLISYYIALNMTWFDFLKSTFGRPSNSPYFSPVNMLCGSFSGVFCWWIIFPIESVRRRMQARGKTTYAENYDSIADCVSKIFKRHGPRGFYLGLLPAWYKIFISSGIMFTTNEKIRNILFSFTDTD